MKKGLLRRLQAIWSPPVLRGKSGFYHIVNKQMASVNTETQSLQKRKLCLQEAAQGLDGFYLPPPPRVLPILFYLIHLAA